MPGTNYQLNSVVTWIQYHTLICWYRWSIRILGSTVVSLNNQPLLSRQNLQEWLLFLHFTSINISSSVWLFWTFLPLFLNHRPKEDLRLHSTSENCQSTLHLSRLFRIINSTEYLWELHSMSQAPYTGKSPSHSPLWPFISLQYFHVFPVPENPALNTPDVSHQGSRREGSPPSN